MMGGLYAQSALLSNTTSVLLCGRVPERALAREPAARPRVLGWCSPATWCWHCSSLAVNANSRGGSWRGQGPCNERKDIPVIQRQCLRAARPVDQVGREPVTGGIDTAAGRTYRLWVTVQERIQKKLLEELSPTQLQVENESSMHSVPPGAESHFKVFVVSPLFEDKSLVQRHRMIYAVLGDDIRETIHALSIAAQTPAEWESSPNRRASPACRGGSH